MNDANCVLFGCVACRDQHSKYVLMQACVAAQHMQEKRRLHAYTTRGHLQAGQAERKEGCHQSKLVLDLITQLRFMATRAHRYMLQALKDLRPPDWGLQTRDPINHGQRLSRQLHFSFPSSSPPLQKAPLRCSTLSIPRVPSTDYLFSPSFQPCVIVETHLTHLPHWSKRPDSAEIFTLIFSRCLLSGPQLDG